MGPEEHEVTIVKPLHCCRKEGLSRLRRKAEVRPEPHKHKDFSLCCFEPLVDLLSVVYFHTARVTERENVLPATQRFAVPEAFQLPNTQL